MKEHRGKCPNFPREKIHAGAVVRTQQDQAFYSCWFPLTLSPSPQKFGVSLILVSSFFSSEFSRRGERVADEGSLRFRF